MSKKERLNGVAGRSREADLFDRLGRLITTAHTGEFPDLLREFLSREITFVSFVVLAFSGDRTPVDLYHWIPYDTKDFYRRNYFRQAFRLDPYYHAALRGAAPGTFRLKDVAPDRFFQSEYYRSYYSRVRMIDELGILCDAESGHVLHLSLGRKRAEGRFPLREVRILQTLQPTISALLQIYARDRLPATGRARMPDERHCDASDLRSIAHADGGAPQLTDREADVTSLILRGHSSRSIGLHLGISPETVKVHRKHIYAKLEVSSQAELFAKLLPVLSDSAAG